MLGERVSENEAMRLSHTSTVIGMLALAVGLATAGLAQTAPPAGTPTGPNALMQLSRRECAQAARIMGNALPIYNGHRVKAIEIAKIAIDEIKLGIQYDRGRGGGTTTSAALQKRLAALENMTEPGGNYTKKQNMQSNRKMQRAAAVLTQAAANLQAAPKDYGGHRTFALQMVNLALGQIQKALGS